MLPDRVIEQIYDLNVGLIGVGADQHERPHKPLLLLSVIALIEEGSVDPARIYYTPQLRAQFGRYFEVVRQRNDKNTPENPFFYLRREGFWIPLSKDERGASHSLGGPPTVADAKAGRVYAEFNAEWLELLRHQSTRCEIRDAIIARYFSKHRQTLVGQQSSGFDPNEASKTAEEEPQEGYGRSSAFRRRVLEIYDYQCAACGLRIKLPPSDLTFVDAAHLIPFRESGNDHPTNGLALCKNHHWAMDRHIIAPTPDRIWKVSPSLDARRSQGEKELLNLQGQRVLIPNEEAFWPDSEGLVWRLSRLIA